MKRLSLCLFALTLIACRAGEERTTVELTFEYNAAWELDTLTVDVDGEIQQLVTPQNKLTLWRDDASSIEVKVTGLKEEVRIAFGESTIVPILNGTKTQTIALTRLPCGSSCVVGTTICQDEHVATCTSIEGCMKWVKDADECPAACSLGMCRDECIDECAEGEVRCDGSTGFRMCQTDPNSCSKWSDSISCTGGQTCSAGKCSDTPQDQCESGRVRCWDLGTSTCGDLDMDGYTEWGPPTPCGDGRTCQSGMCVEECRSECTEPKCEDGFFKECGEFDGDPCADLSFGTSCLQASNSCMVGMCDPTQGCVTTPKECPIEPPAPDCDGNIRRTYTGPSVCVEGACVFTDVSETCMPGMTCFNGICGPIDPCMDGVQNGDETGVDCGGGTCPACTSQCTHNPQSGCNAGSACYPMVDGGSVTPICLTEGSGDLGDNCVMLQDCKSDLACIKPAKDSRSICRQVCNEQSDCTVIGSLCVDFLRGCSEPCSPHLLQETGCSATDACVIESDSGFAFTDCQTEGRRFNGEECSTTNRCVKGHGCHSGLCRKYCRIGMSSSDCMPNWSCTPYAPQLFLDGVEYGGCQPP